MQLVRSHVAAAREFGDRVADGSCDVYTTTDRNAVADIHTLADHRSNHARCRERSDLRDRQCPDRTWDELPSRYQTQQGDAGQRSRSRP